MTDFECQVLFEMVRVHGLATVIREAADAADWIGCDGEPDAPEGEEVQS